MGRSWRAVGEFEWREWDGEAVAYCDVSGDTLKLTPMARVVLQRIAAGEATLPDLVAHAATMLGLPNHSEIEGDVGDIVAEFDEFGLIESCSA
jgi:PqqD family protein of HPr-rel-A system